MPTQVIVVPEQAWQALGGKAAKRVVATLNGHAERLGLVIGQEVAVQLAPDPNPDHVDLPDELAEALAAWPEAEASFLAQSGAMRRAIARKVADAKRPDTRARYAVELAERLARGAHPFRAGTP
jgi:uncharacterized protein YdeI (YjbR/CyaY-like superfamily)